MPRGVKSCNGIWLDLEKAFDFSLGGTTRMSKAVFPGREMIVIKMMCSVKRRDGRRVSTTEKVTTG